MYIYEIHDWYEVLCITTQWHTAPIHRPWGISKLYSQGFLKFLRHHVVPVLPNDYKYNVPGYWLQCCGFAVAVWWKTSILVHQIAQDQGEKCHPMTKTYQVLYLVRLVLVFPVICGRLFGGNP